MKQNVACFGEIMLRLNPPGRLRFAQAQSFDAGFAGSEANVACNLAQWGVPASFITALPDNEIGKLALSSLKKFGVDTSRSVATGDRIGILYLEMGSGSRPSKVVYDRGQSSTATLCQGAIDWKVALADATWFHWSGITPALSSGAAEVVADAVQTAKALGLTVSCDVNYRSALWKWGKQPSEVMPELVKQCDVLLGDGDANALYFGTPQGDYETVAKETMASFPNLKYLALTARKTHSATHQGYQGFLYDGTTMFASREHDIQQVEDRIGTGDAFMAGLIYGLTQEKVDKQYTVDFAAASAALKHTVYGDYNLVSKEEIEALMGGDTGGRVKR